VPASSGGVGSDKEARNVGVRIAFLIKKQRGRQSLQLTCPVCEYAESRAHRAWRLEVCPRCRADGREVYLADAAAKTQVARVRPKPLANLARVASRFGRPAT
jgi:hypothetical protein